MWHWFCSLSQSGGLSDLDLKIGSIEVDMAPKNGASRKEKGLEGKYANYFAVGYNAHEYIFDFGQHYSESETAKLHTRIITSPAYAKAFLKMLRDSIDQYEQYHGIIDK